jgi:hypothetical protein
LIESSLERIFELYEFCCSEAKRMEKDIIFEVGPFTTKNMDTPEELEYALDQIYRFCRLNLLPAPSFVVLQTGTLVMETRNVGPFEDLLKQPEDSLSQRSLQRMIKICERYEILAKEHNADYLSDAALAWHPRIGIHSANIAPELGITETRTLMGLLKKADRKDLLEEFIFLAIASDKWRKWMLPGTIATPEELAVISGHYVFAYPRCVAIKAEAAAALNEQGIDLEQTLRQAIKDSILRYIHHFQLTETLAAV